MLCQINCLVDNSKELHWQGQIAAKPALILADEPTGNLDSKTSLDVLGLSKVTSEKYHQTVVMITHNDEIAQMAHRIIRIEDGMIRGGDAL